MSKCITCKREYCRNGGIMISLCSDCIKAESAPDGRILSAGGILIPNPEYPKWEEREKRRIKDLQQKETIA